MLPPFDRQLTRAMVTNRTDVECLVEPAPPSLERSLRKLTFCLPQASLLVGDAILYVHSSLSGRLALSAICSLSGRERASIRLPDEHYDQLHLVRLDATSVGLCYRNQGVWMRVVTLADRDRLVISEEARLVMQLPAGCTMARVLAGHRVFYGVAWDSDGHVHFFDLAAEGSPLPPPLHSIRAFHVEEVALVGRKVYLITDREIGVFDFGSLAFTRCLSTGYVKNEACFVEFEQTTVWRDRHIFVLTGASELWRLDALTMKWTRIMPLDSFPAVHVPCFTINEEGYLLIMTVWDFYDEQSEARSYWISVPPLESLAARSSLPPPRLSISSPHNPFDCAEAIVDM